MPRAIERRAQRAHGITNNLLSESKWVIWCYDPQHMAAMIDLLVAKGVLSESDRPHCVHYEAVMGLDRLTRDDLGRVLDADAMLEQAGIPTLTGQLSRDPEARKALQRELSGESQAPPELDGTAS